MPSRSRVMLLGSLAAGLVLIVGTLIGSLPLGSRALLSPGDVASHHAQIDLKCVQCHDEGNAVAAVRCERCHDPSLSGRLGHPSHVLLGSGDARKAGGQADLECAMCHREHRGATASLRAVDDRECATCHGFRDLASHPEFAVTLARATAGVGMMFGHKRHLVETQNDRGETCQVCHQQTPDRRSFQPINFDRHCASCHTTRVPISDTDPVASDLVVPPEELPDYWRRTSKATLAPSARKLVAKTLAHRDGWVLFNALRLRQSIDRDAEFNERLVLKAQTAYLRQLQGASVTHQIPVAQLGDAIAAVQREITDLDAILQQQASGPSVTEALAPALEAVRAMATTLAESDQSAQTELQSLLSDVARPLPPSVAALGDDSDAASRFDRRRRELMNALDVIAKRAAEGDSIRQRVVALRAQVESLAPSATATATEGSALLARLDQLDEVLSTIRAVPDPGTLAQLADVEVLRQSARQRIAMGIPAEDFDGRKAELLALLDAVERRSSDVERLRIDSLRQRIIALRPATIDDVDLQRLRRQRQRQLERLLLEQELAASPRGQHNTPTQDAGPDQIAIRESLTRLQNRLADLERTPRMNAPTDESERARRGDTIAAVLGACSKCHETDTSGFKLAAVRIAEPVMPRSIFNHAPHTTQANCETCHASVRDSELSTDANVPNVTLCQSCHTPAKARSSCETCHVYHPGSPAALVRMSP